MNIPPLPQGFVNRYADGTPNTAAAKFPQNLAASLTPEVAKKMLLWLNTNYIWPQIQERVPFEAMWEKMLLMARVQLPTENLFLGMEGTKTGEAAKNEGRNKARVADTVVHDAIQRLTDVTYFIAFKEGFPAQFVRPEYIQTPESTPEYQPLKNKIQASNCLLHWNAANHKVKRNSRLAYAHHFTYGLAYVRSEYKFRVENIARQDNSGQIIPRPEITEIGTTFEPLSCRKIWVNWRLPAYSMDLQPCPFYFDEVPRFAIMQNAYDPVMNPFGYLNLDKAMSANYIYADTETSAVQAALQATFTMMENTGAPRGPTAQILEPKHSVEARWTLFPMMPFDPLTGEFETRADGKTPIPYARFVMETFGPNVHSGAQNILRLQEMYYPKGKIPIYTSVHMPDLDSGQYAPSLGQVLWNHYKEITTCTEQYFNNKDWINDPPAWVQVSSPASNVDLNVPGQRIKVNGPNDFGWRTPYDATASTVSMRQMLREEAKTTSKVVDAILGKAMGSRTSATEASNAFQASMSAITTDIDMLSTDLHAEYAERMLDYAGLWMDPDLLRAITGQFGFAISPEDLWLTLGIQSNVGSTYVEKIVRQQNIRYILESSKMEPGLNRAELWSELLKDMGFDPSNIVDDGGRAQQIQFATVQACETYLGRPTLVDPDQDHQIAIKVKTAFIKDQGSFWNITHPEMGQVLIQQIEQHQAFLQLQQQMMLAQQQMQVAQAQLNVHRENPPEPQNPGQGSTGPAAATPGQIAQQGAGA